MTRTSLFRSLLRSVSRPAPGHCLAPALLALGLIFWPAATSADTLWPRGQPVLADYDRYMAQGDDFAIQAASIKYKRNSSLPRQPRDYQAVVERAAAAYEQAAAQRPQAAEPHYRAAEVLYVHILSLPVNTPVIRDRSSAERALGHWRAFAERAPMDPRATESLFQQALVHTKLADEDGFARAAECYETILMRRDAGSAHPAEVATWLSNLAETYMMLGRLNQAVALYRRALDYSPRSAYGYGLAVALDRAEQGELAREIMHIYAQSDRLGSLASDDYFFVPEGERNYYLALGFEVLGELEQAIVFYQLFLDSGAHPRYQPRARQHIHRLLEQRRKRASKRVPRLPEDLGQ